MDGLLPSLGKKLSLSVEKMDILSKVQGVSKEESADGVFSATFAAAIGLALTGQK